MVAGKRMKAKLATLALGSAGGIHELCSKRSWFC